MSYPEAPIDSNLVIQLRNRNVNKNETNPHLKSQIVEGCPQPKQTHSEPSLAKPTSPPLYPNLAEEYTDRRLANFYDTPDDLVDHAIKNACTQGGSIN